MSLKPASFTAAPLYNRRPNMHNGLKVKWEGFKTVKNYIAFMTSDQPENCVNEETSCNVGCVCVCQDIHQPNTSTHSAPYTSDTRRMRHAHFGHSDRWWGAAGLLSGRQALEWHHYGKEEWKLLRKQQPRDNTNPPQTNAFVEIPADTHTQPQKSAALTSKPAHAPSGRPRQMHRGQ